MEGWKEKIINYKEMLFLHNKDERSKWQKNCPQTETACLKLNATTHKMLHM